MKRTHLFILLFIFVRLSVIASHGTPIFSLTSHKKSNEQFSISSHDDMTIVQEGKARVQFTAPLSVDVQRHKIKINGTRVKKGTWHLIPHNGKLVINKQTYDGSAILHICSRMITITPHKNIAPTTLIEELQQTTKASNPSSLIISALIHELSSSTLEPARITSHSGFIFYDPQTPASKKEYKQGELLITSKNNILLINGQQCDQHQLRIIPKDGYAGVNGNQFHGSLSIVHHDNRFLIINHVDLEEYIYSVLKTESWPGWPIEVNKAFAIASRSYAMATMKKANKAKQPYHIKNTSEHQNYKGMHTNSALRTAVEETRGMFLMHQNEPVLAMFDICCGGIIPALVDQFDFTKVPYLARTYPCKHCKRSARYSWKKELSLTDLATHIEKILKKPVKVNDVKISKKDKAGLVHELHVSQGKETHPITGKQLYNALKKDVKSFCYTVQRKKNTVIFTGRGMGHHLGICQWGAREMVNDGWPYQRILSFYYPGTSLMKLT